MEVNFMIRENNRRENLAILLQKIVKIMDKKWLELT